MKDVTPTESLIRLIASCAAKLGMGDHSFVVGGSPRDFVLGHEIKDVDVVVEPKGDKGAPELASEISRVLGVTSHPDRYGVCHVGPVPGSFKHLDVDLSGQKAEIVTSRSEKYDRTLQRDSHKPVSVAPGTILEDLSRRDFTINTLMWRLSDLEHGPRGAPVVDLLGSGLQDLKDGVIRTPLEPAETFDDDPSRMLRAVRFAVKYGFVIDDSTYSAISSKAGELRRLPYEGVAEIFVDKILPMDSGKLVRALDLMAELGLLQPVKTMIPSGRVRRGVMSSVKDPAATLRLASLGFDVGVKFRNGHLDRLLELERTTESKEFSELFGRFRRPLDVEPFMAATGVSGEDVGKAVEKARDLVLLGLDHSAVQVSLVREHSP